MLPKVVLHTEVLLESLNDGEGAVDIDFEGIVKHPQVSSSKVSILNVHILIALMVDPIINDYGYDGDSVR